ncbi:MULTISPECIES: PEP-CTERM sorting domain-containing protein [Rhodobacterales]|uniref:PEP-CTERM sorting domain-containing protein n=1 Tax=Rhodobacterales TaxID=204455 RepID=UPI0032976622
MKLRSVLISTAACALLSSASYAVTVTLNVSGTTVDAEGTLNYTPGSTFTAKAVFDDGFADTNADPNVGSFFDFRAATTALVSFELTTEFGTISYDPSAVQGATGSILAPQVAQIRNPLDNRQTFSLTTHLGGDPVNNGFSGAMGPLAANSIGMTMFGDGPNTYFFDNPNSLFSGSENGFSTDANFLGGTITATQFGGFDTTTLFFGAGEFSIVGGDGDIGEPLAPVPLPASLPLMAFGLLGLGWAARRKKQRA